MSDRIVVGIDASRNRSGGAKSHLIGLLEESFPEKYGIQEVHVWSYRDLLGLLPNRSWLIKHSPDEIHKSLLHQLWWQCFNFPGEARAVGCSIVFNTDAGTISRFRPSVTLSQDMLSYEPGEINRYGFTKARLRLIALRFVQNQALRASDGVIFLTNYAARMIQKSCGPLPWVSCIPHGIGNNFKQVQPSTVWNSNNQQIKCLYVSNTAFYKHQWMVVQAVEILRNRGYNLTIDLVGGGSGEAQVRLDRQVSISDPKGEFVSQIGFVPHKDLPLHLANTDIFIFASSCENMPNTLVEAMSVGLPIACSNRGPMPEVLSNAGVYFNPEEPQSIANAVSEIIENVHLRKQICDSAKQRSQQFSWSRCADETWSFIVETYLKTKEPSVIGLVKA
ncbi:glycosyl transferase family 1 [Cylindrospermopsis raciborskii CENA303]|uniref:Glycosyl transferase family 1 n=1 Tax=Cylindrospermopsis raciborskii CENA303 TaxID=1170769 RepID=A0A1X4G6K5_9CYAN|nr:glycosyltransferase family 1 protein [Cylindrospermopsis raciborskii]OSO90598.1 glycosyl transferase family 1 [Cylindrospermopsis raciborskii CENA303]